MIALLTRLNKEELKEGKNKKSVAKTTLVSFGGLKETIFEPTFFKELFELRHHIHVRPFHPNIEPELNRIYSDTPFAGLSAPVIPEKDLLTTTSVHHSKFLELEKEFGESLSKQNMDLKFDENSNEEKV